MAVSEREARQVAEEARETDWKEPSFLKELFLGHLRLDLVPVFPPREERPAFRVFYEKMERFLRDEVDGDAIDRDGKIPQRVLDGLAALGAFGMKIETEYGGLGFTQHEYGTIIKLVSSVDGNLIALLSAHQSIGVPQPLRLFGTEEQKKKWLPRLAKGAVSAFALTEPQVGSDPANLSTTATRTPEGDYVLNGDKLWTTNGTIADSNPNNSYVLPAACAILFESRCASEYSTPTARSPDATTLGRTLNKGVRIGVSPRKSARISLRDFNLTAVNRPKERQSRVL